MQRQQFLAGSQRRGVGGFAVIGWTVFGLMAMALSVVPAAARETKPARRPAGRPSHPAFEQVSDVPGLPRVLIIGDSISMGYTLPLRAALEGKANLHRPATNCGPSSRGVEQLESWLETGGSDRWDVIQFNFGLHDIRHFSDPGNTKPVGATEGHRQVLEEAYDKNLRVIVDRLKQTGAKLIWRNTTPVPEGANGRVPGDEVRYNEIAKQIMEENEIEIDDMHAFCVPLLNEIQQTKDVHFKDAGSKVLAEEASKKILAALPAP